MKKLTAILLLTCLCCTLLCYHFVFNYQLRSAKAEMRAYLKNQKANKDVVQISLTEREIKDAFWENEHEFRFKGEMYDVIEVKKAGDVIIVRCIPDNKETSLLNEYQKNNKRNSSNSAIVQLVTAAFVLPVDHSLQPPERLVNNYFKDYSFRLQNMASTVLLPPPDVC